MSLNDVRLYLSPNRVARYHLSPQYLDRHAPGEGPSCQAELPKYGRPQQSHQRQHRRQCSRTELASNLQKSPPMGSERRTLAVKVDVVVVVVVVPPPPEPPVDQLSYSEAVACP